MLASICLVVATASSGTVGQKIVDAARSQIGVTVIYDPSYRRLVYPGGDFPAKSGVCTDVVIRALRSACRFDLQSRVHDDMKGHFSLYPTKWGMKHTDANIDHRRVPNLQVFFRRSGWQVKSASKYLPGDFVTCMLPRNLPHIMVVSDRFDGKGVPLVIHNIGQGVREESALKLFPITGHYRFRE